MKRNNAILIILIILFTTVGVSSIVHYFYTTVTVKDYEIVAMVRKNIGIDVGTDKIYFGGIKPGGGSSRELIISNSKDTDVLVKMIKFGELKDYVSLSDNLFIINPNQTRKIDISLGVPEDMPYGNYTGKLRVIIKKA